MLKRMLVASAMLAALSGSAAFAADLAINGFIEPSACTITLGDGGVVTYHYSSSEVMQMRVAYDAYAAPTRQILMSVRCNAPAYVSISLEDNRSDSKFEVHDSQDPVGYGLGFGSLGQKIGQFRVDLTKLVGSSTTAGALKPPQQVFMKPLVNTRDWWTSSTVITPSVFLPGYKIAFDFDGLAMGPSPASRIEGNLGIDTYFNKALVDRLDETLRLDGLATFHLHYN